MTLKNRVETAVTKIEESSDIAEKFADASAIVEFNTPKGLVKPIGLLQQEAEAAIQSMTSFNEQTFVATTVYDGTEKVYFVDSGIAYTPVIYPYITGFDVAADVTAGKLMVLQGLTVGDTGTLDNQVPKNSDLHDVLSRIKVMAAGTTTLRSLENRFADSVNAKDFDGSTQADQIQNFIEFCETNSVLGEISDEYDLDGQTITISETVDIRCIGNGRLINGTVEAKGSLGDEIGLTGTVNKGDTTIPVVSEGIVAGDVIFIRSVINCLSSDAGDDRLGAFSSPSFFSEFLIVKSVSGSEIEVEEGVKWDYTNTAGANSWSRTNSTIQKVNFISDLKLDLNMNEKTSSELAVLNLEYCKNAQVTGKYSIEGEGYLITMFRCLDSVASNVYTSRPAYNVQSSTYNSFLTKGSVRCGIEDSTLRGGYQCIDFTFDTSEELANPSMLCFANNIKAYDCYDGATSHGGTYSSTFDSVKVFNSFNGIRTRSRLDGVYNCTVEKPSSGFGILIADGYNQGSIFSGNTVKNCQYGVHVQLDDQEGNATVSADISIVNTVAISCATGVEIETRTATNQRAGVVVDGLMFINGTSKAVNIGGYNNGVDIKNVTSIGTPSSGRAVVEYFLNIYDLSISNITAIGNEVPVIRGQSVGSFITDLTTFPDGDSSANLSIRNIYIADHTGVEYKSIMRSSDIFNKSLIDFSYGYGIGPVIRRQQWSSVSDDLIEAQNSAGGNVFSVTTAGTLNGSKPNSVKSAIAAATDIATLKAALDDLFD